MQDILDNDVACATRHVLQIDDAGQPTHLCIQHILDLYAKLVEESCRVLATVMHDLGHIYLLQYGFEVSKHIFTDVKHVKQIACVAVKHLQAPTPSQYQTCRCHIHLHCP